MVYRPPGGLISGADSWAISKASRRSGHDSAEVQGGNKQDTCWNPMSGRSPWVIRYTTHRSVLLQCGLSRKGILIGLRGEVTVTGSDGSTRYMRRTNTY